MSGLAVPVQEKALERLLSSKSGAVRLATVKCLRLVPAPWSVPLLIRAMEDEDIQRDISGVAVEALGRRRGDRRAADALMKALNTPWFTDLQTVIEALGELGDARAVEKLIFSLGNVNASARVAAASALNKLGEPTWRESVKGEPKDFLRLGLTGDARAMQPLRHALECNWPLDGVYAAGGLASLGDESAIERLIKALNDRDLSHQEAAAEAMGTLNDERTLEALEQALARPKWYVKLFAAGALGKRRHPKGIKFLTDAIDSMEHLRGEIATTLGKTGDPAAIQPLYRLLLDANPAARSNAANALCAVGEPGWMKLIHGNSDDFIRVVRAPALPCLEPLALFLKTPESSGTFDMMRAIRALARLGGIAISKHLIDVFFESTGIVRIAAAEEMALLGEPCWLLLTEEDVQAFHSYYDTDPLQIYQLRQVLGDGRVSEGIRAEAARLLGRPGARGSQVR